MSVPLFDLDLKLNFILKTNLRANQNYAKGAQEQVIRLNMQKSELKKIIKSKGVRT